MDEHELLIRHARNWAATKKRDLDPELLETALDLRSVHDELADTYWPAGTVEHLMLGRWPSHGPHGEPDAPSLAATLDTFVHFLRATGRMSSGSADPKTLAKEARRAAPKMAEACADIGAHSQTKVMLGFAAERGIDLHDAASVEELQARLDETMRAWNALPEEERFARMPLTSNVPNALSQRTSEMFGGSGGHFDPRVAAGLLADDGADEWDEDDDAVLERSDPTLSAVHVRESGFVRACLALLDWIGDGRPVTRTGVLRLKVAEQAFDELGLAEWDARSQFASLRALEGFEPTKDELAAASVGFFWKSSGECLALDRLWYPLQATGDIATTSTKATVVPRPRATDEEWVIWGLMLVTTLLRRVEESIQLGPLLYILGNGALHGTPLGLDDVLEWWMRAEANPDARLARTVPGWAANVREFSERSLARVVQLFDDTGIWTREGDTLRVTPFGRDLAVVFFGMLEDAELEL